MSGVVDGQDRFPQIVRMLTEIGSLLALATALLYYFGWIRSETQARAFGADASVFVMSTQDYILRSMDVVFIPVLLLLLVSLFGVWLHRRFIPTRTAVSGSSALKINAPALRRIGRIANVLSLAWLLPIIVGVPLLLVTPTVGRLTLPFWFACGILGTWYGSSLRRIATADRSSVARHVVLLVAALFAVTLFWMTERVARIVGEAHAVVIKDDVAKELKAVTVYSAKRLHIDGRGVVETALGDAEDAYRYRYDGLFLLQRSGGRYFLLTLGWDVGGGGRLIVLPDNDLVRFEFGPGR
ncbi:MAG: hypothetical protein ACT4NY_11470 [Pseudonocardiales bacterium]